MRVTVLMWSLRPSSLYILANLDLPAAEAPTPTLCSLPPHSGRAGALHSPGGNPWIRTRVWARLRRRLAHQHGLPCILHSS